MMYLSSLMALLCCSLITCSTQNSTSTEQWPSQSFDPGKTQKN